MVAIVAGEPTAGVAVITTFPVGAAVEPVVVITTVALKATPTFSALVALILSAVANPLTVTVAVLPVAAKSVSPA
jgi:hypothetical protein